MRCGIAAPQKPSFGLDYSRRIGKATPPRRRFAAQLRVPLLLTLHPAYLLRQPAHKKLAWRDLQSLAAKMEELAIGPARQTTS